MKEEQDIAANPPLAHAPRWEASRKSSPRVICAFIYRLLAVSDSARCLPVFHRQGRAKQDIKVLEETEFKGDTGRG